MDPPNNQQPPSPPSHGVNNRKAVDLTIPMAMLGKKSRPPNAPETQPPLANGMSETKESDLFLHLYFIDNKSKNTYERIKSNMMINNMVIFEQTTHQKVSPKLGV